MSDLLGLSHAEASQFLSQMGDEELRVAMSGLLNTQQEMRQQNSLLFYKPVSEKAEKIHQSDANVLLINGGNGSSKTECAIVEMIMCATGVFPLSLRDKIDIDKKFRGPINCRIVCESLTNTLHSVILPKFKWWEWDGIDQPGGDRGHWGWLGKHMLVGGSWQQSWSEKYRTLKVLCRDPHTDDIVGESKIQMMSHDQDYTDFASGNFHIVVMDEPPRQTIYTENQARTMRVNGRIILAMTWPDDPAINVDWIFDEIYEPSQPGPDKDPDIDSFTLWSIDNPHQDQNSIAKQEKKWSREIADVRLRGQSIRFGNRVHPLFTDITQWWCFICKKPVTPRDGACSCGSSKVAPFNHVSEFDAQPTWPTVFLLDMHPRKPHEAMWVQVSPSDDLWQIAELSADEPPVNFKKLCDEIEHQFSLNVTMRLCDPNMGQSPANARNRNSTWRNEFDLAGLYCDLADDADVGRNRVNEYLAPDESTMEPRIHIHARCEKTRQQMKRFSWDDHKRGLDKAQKQQTKKKFDDFPALYRYLLNADPDFRHLKNGFPVLRPRGQRARIERHVRSRSW